MSDLPEEAKRLAKDCAVDLMVAKRMSDGCNSLFFKDPEELAAEVIALALPLLREQIAQEAIDETKRWTIRTPTGRARIEALRSFAARVAGGTGEGSSE